MDRPLIAAAAPALGDAVEKRVPVRALLALVKECREVSRLVQRLSVTEHNNVPEMNLRNRILSRLLDAVTPWYAMEGESVDDEFPVGRAFTLVRQAEEKMMKIGLAAPLSMDRLAGTLDVSKRTLFYSFNEWLEMGPHAYFDILRLHHVRKRLLAGTKTTTSVTAAANEMGFSHLGRFAGRYYRFFGEHPSETLARDQI